MSIVKLNNRGVRSATAFGSISALGEMRFIKKQTASSSATISFVDGTSDVVLDDTYKEYLFTFNNIHPATDTANFTFNVSIDSGSNYNVAKTTTQFRAVHDEADSATSLAYETDGDLAQGTGVQILQTNLGADNDQSASGYLHLFNPSSTTFVKHFIFTGNRSHAGNYTGNEYVAGYANTTSAVDAIQFSMSSGNIDAGDICLYGIN
jgi:hypothetical protein